MATYLKQTLRDQSPQARDSDDEFTELDRRPDFDVLSNGPDFFSSILRTSSSELSVLPITHR